MGLVGREASPTREGKREVQETTVESERVHGSIPTTGSRGLHEAADFTCFERDIGKCGRARQAVRVDRELVCALEKTSAHLLLSRQGPAGRRQP